MTIFDSGNGWIRIRGTRLAALVGGITLAAFMTFGPAVGSASAETVAEFLAGRCSNYIANPQSGDNAASHCAWADLTGIDLSGVNLSRADLSYANLASAPLVGANLVRAYLAATNLTGANLTGAHLTGAILEGSALMPADITVHVKDAGWSHDGAYVTWETPRMPIGVRFGCDHPSGTKFPLTARS